MAETEILRPATIHVTELQDNRVYDGEYMALVESYLGLKTVSDIANSWNPRPKRIGYWGNGTLDEEIRQMLDRGAELVGPIHSMPGMRWQWLKLKAEQS